MKVATLLIVLYGAGTGAGVAHPHGVSCHTGVGHATATGSQASPQLGTRHRPPAPFVLRQHGWAPVVGRWAHAGVGRATATGGAGARPHGQQAAAQAGLARVSAAGWAQALGGRARAVAGHAGALAGAQALPRGLPSRGIMGRAVGHPDPAERAWLDLQRAQADEDALLLMGVLEP